MTPPIEYIPEPLPDPALNDQIITILTACFSRPQDAIFQTQRFFMEMPQHRWVIRDPGDAGRLIAHVAMHDKTIGTAVGDMRIAGVAEVCVHPDVRGRGYVREMLKVFHDFAQQHGMQASLLFGETSVYSSSGYVNVSNPIRYIDRYTDEAVTQPIDNLMVRMFQGDWPTGEIDLRCKPF